MSHVHPVIQWLRFIKLNTHNLINVTKPTRNFTSLCIWPRAPHMAVSNVSEGGVIPYGTLEDC